MAALAGDFTCFAFDTPGYGDSAPLQTGAGSIAAVADALADTLRTLNFPPCPVFGSHTGAAIALELARRHPELITGLILDGVAMFTPQEQVEIFDGYFAPLVLDELGGHFAHTWTRFRDLFIWFPWTRKRPENLNDASAPTAQRLQLWVSMFFRAAENYAATYRAAIAYGGEAADAIRQLRVPAVFMAQHSDMLFAHLDRLPPLPAGQRIERVSQVQKPAAIYRAALQFAANGPPPPDPVPQFGASGVSRGFLDLPHGQVLIRLAGAATETRPLLLLHDAPGSSLALEPLMQQLASRRRVVTLDLPGGGESPPLALAPASLADFVALVERILDVLQVESCDVYGQGFGSSLALELSALNPRRFPKVTLHGLCLPERSQRQELLERYAPPIELAADGSHWYRTWLMLRDSLIYFPWYEGRASALRRAPGDFDARQLHERTFEVLKQYQGYSQFIHAALTQDIELRCRDAHRAGVALQLWNDPLHPFATWADRQSALVRSLELPVAAAAAGNWVHALFEPT